MNKDFINECVSAHRNAFEIWSEGEVAKTWIENEVLCIKYESGKWWHYRKDEKGNIEWW